MLIAPGEALPNVTSDRVCCPTCGVRAPFLPNGLTDWHNDPAGRLCDDVFPPYVVARDPMTGKVRRPVTHRLRRSR